MRSFKYLLFGAGLFTVFSLILLTKKKTIEKKSPQEILNEKLAPHDHFDIMRSYPSLVPDQAGIEQALHETYMLAQNSARSAGFDQEWVTEGPANIGARINAIAVPEGKEDTIYIGYAKGGVYRTFDGGNSWESIFDDQEQICIGSITINPENDAVIYVGTGDKNIGGSFRTGNGVYKSTDYGDSWTHLGLSDQKIISEIAINPLDTSVVYASAMGSPSLPDANRGLYKSSDAGSTWSQVLYIGDSAGINDIAINPNNPNIIYASGWNRYRSNQASIISGNASKIWKSSDAGNTWVELSNGLPGTPNGRVGISMYTPNPDTLYALYVGTDAELEGVYRTFDGGNSWVTIPTVTNGVSPSALGGFGWYFSGIHVNPYDYNDVFFNGVQSWRTQNGGASWSEADPPWFTYEVHADKHDMEFLGPNTFLLATDGGLYKTTNNAVTWTKIEENMTNEVYRVAHSNLRPNDYFGGLQDNGSTGGNASNPTWPRIYGGDGFQMKFNSTNEDLFYAETQNGNIVATQNGGISFSSVNFPQSQDRTNWDTPFILSSHDANKMYAGGYEVFVDNFTPFGSWSSISGDLTDGNIYGNSFHTISGIDESRINANRLYVCTSDGNVWRTTNMGTSWDSIHSGLPNRYVTSIKASPSDQNHVFVTHSGYKYNDFFSHVHKSIDNGITWQSIAGDLPPIAINDILIYPNHADSVLFIGTDAGVYATKDGGLDWERLGINMPMISVMDLELDSVNNRLIAATFGKSVMTYPLDSLVTPVDDTISTPFVVTFIKEDQTCISSANGSITAAVTGGTPPYTYSWSNGISSEINLELVSGTYTLTITDANGELQVETQTIAYNPIYPSPSVGPLTGNIAAQAWQNFNYSVPFSAGSVFNWNISGGTLQSSTFHEATILWGAGPTGTIILEETNSFGCKSMEAFSVGIEFVGTEELADNMLLIYPNPSNGIFTVDFGKPIIEGNIEVRSAIGQVVYSGTITASTSVLLNLKVASGNYFVSCKANDQVYNKWMMID